MKVQPDKLEILPNPCVDTSQFPQSQAENWNTQIEINNNLGDQIDELYELIEALEVDGTSDHKVSLDAADNTAAQFDYLNAKMYYQAAGEIVTWPDVGVPVVADIAGDDGELERLRVDFSQVPGYPTEPGDLVGHELALKLVGDGDVGPSVVWEELGDAADDHLVIVTALGDTTPKALHQALHLNEIYVSGADMLVSSETVGGTGTNQHERLFTDVSKITGHSDTGFLFLTLQDNVSKYEEIGTELVNSITGISLSLTGSSLTLTVSYTTYEVYGSLVTSSTFSSSVDTTTC